MSIAFFNFSVAEMSQAEADALWDKILEGSEALGHTGQVRGAYKVLEIDSDTRISSVEVRYEEPSLS